MNLSLIAKLFGGTVLALSMVASSVRADPPVTPPPLVQFQQGLAGTQVVLTWQAVPNGRYVVQSATDLTDWRDREVVTPTSDSGSWMDSEPAGQAAFYRIVLPSAAVFGVEPAVISPGGDRIMTLEIQRPFSCWAFSLSVSSL